MTIQEAEAQIVTHYEVYSERPSDSDLLIPSIAVHEQLLDRSPYMVTGDAAFFSQSNEKAAHSRGVKRVAIPTAPPKMRTASDSRRSADSATPNGSAPAARAASAFLKRVQRWVRLGVIADNLIHIGLSLPER